MSSRFHDNAQVDLYLSQIDSTLHDRTYAKRFAEELADHIDDAVYDSVVGGTSEEVAIESALEHVGDSDEIAWYYNKTMKFKDAWKLYLEAFLMGFILWPVYLFPTVTLMGALSVLFAEPDAIHYFGWFTPLMFTVVGAVVYPFIARLLLQRFRLFSEHKKQMWIVWGIVLIPTAAYALSLLVSIVMRDAPVAAYIAVAFWLLATGYALWINYRILFSAELRKYLSVRKVFRGIRTKMRLPHTAHKNVVLQLLSYIAGLGGVALVFVSTLILHNYKDELYYAFAAPDMTEWYGRVAIMISVSRATAEQMFFSPVQGFLFMPGGWIMITLVFLLLALPCVLGVYEFVRSVSVRQEQKLFPWFKATVLAYIVSLFFLPGPVLPAVSEVVEPNDIHKATWMVQAVPVSIEAERKLLPGYAHNWVRHFTYLQGGGYQYRLVKSGESEMSQYKAEVFTRGGTYDLFFADNRTPNNAMNTLTLIRKSAEQYTYSEKSGPLPEQFVCKNASDEKKKWRTGTINRCSSLEFNGADILTKADEIGIQGVRYSQDTAIAWIILSGQYGWDQDVIYQVDLLALSEAGIE